MLLYRVVPHLSGAERGEPGHPLYIHPDQGHGRFDNADLYLAMYVASEPSGAIGEVFQSITHWTRAMLVHPAVPKASRDLATLFLDEENHPTLDLDDARALLDRNLRPSDVVLRNRPKTQGIARDIYREGRWSGITFRSNVRPQWTVQVLWDLDHVELAQVEPLPGHPALLDANERLFKPPLPRDLR